ncbi:Kelch-like protein 5, partial [Durusdinium trenchii]
MFLEASLVHQNWNYSAENPRLRLPLRWCAGDAAAREPPSGGGVLPIPQPHPRGCSCAACRLFVQSAEPAGCSIGGAELGEHRTVETSSRVEEADSGHRLELQITDGPLEGTFLTVGEEGARVGRHTSNTLVIPEAGISRFHCEITFMDGEFNLKDLGSTTGTFFYLRPHGHFQIFPGLMVKLGETEMQVLAQSSAEPSLTVLFTEG